MKKLAIALGGGGARGLAHIGFLRILEKENLPISRISGCSMGAMIGGAYCLFQNIKDVEEYSFRFINNPLFKEFNFDDFASIDKHGEDLKSKATLVLGRIKVGISFFKTLAHPSIYNLEVVEKIYAEYPEAQIEDLPLPFSVTANDIITGDEIMIKSGSLRKAIQASSAIPGYFPAVPYDKYMLVDGGVTNLVPTNHFKKNDDELIIGIDVSQPLKKKDLEIKSGITILQRAEAIREDHLAQIKTHNADKIVHCKLQGVSWADFSEAKNIIKMGETAGKQFVRELEKSNLF
ncbi:MAG: patatin-like phospholipase family protein [Bacteroidales bacterium]|nr:patatin-like phospholipase family protein [Bacteroidales bacterium]